MKKKFVILIIGILTLTFCVNSCSKKNDNKSEIVKNKNSKVNNSEMTVPGYALGEVPIIQIPEIPRKSSCKNYFGYDKKNIFCSWNYNNTCKS